MQTLIKLIVLTLLLHKTLTKCDKKGQWDSIFGCVGITTSGFLVDSKQQGEKCCQVRQCADFNQSNSVFWAEDILSGGNCREGLEIREIENKLDYLDGIYVKNKFSCCARNFNIRII